MKYCRDCKFLEDDYTSRYMVRHWCHALEKRTKNIITGREIERNVFGADDMRDEKHECGPEAKLYIRKRWKIWRPK